VANPEAVFGCTPGRVFAASRRRLAGLLIGLAAATGLAAFYAVNHQRLWPAILALGVGVLALFALRMSGDLDPRRLTLAAGRLTLQTRRHLVERDVAGAEARRLETAEIDHLARLISTGPFVTASGGFDSQKLGEFDLYASDLSNAVLIELGEERLIVTPDEPDRFLESLRDSKLERSDAPVSRGGRRGGLPRGAA